MTEIEVLVKSNCPLCREAIQTIEETVKDTQYSYKTRNIEDTPGLMELYGDELPVIMIDDVAEFRLFVEREELEEKLGIESE